MCGLTGFEGQDFVRIALMRRSQRDTVTAASIMRAEGPSANNCGVLVAKGGDSHGGRSERCVKDTE